MTRLQEEIDKLLAPLTPIITTPKEPEIIENIEDDAKSISSNASSSPFELCEVTDVAIIETNDSRYAGD